MKGTPVDINDIGKNGYNMLVKNNVIPNKQVIDLTDEERTKLTEQIKAYIVNNVNQITFSNQESIKAVMMSVLLSHIIAYVNGVDLNNYIQVSLKTEK